MLCVHAQLGVSTTQGALTPSAGLARTQGLAVVQVAVAGGRHDDLVPRPRRLHAARDALQGLQTSSGTTRYMYTSLRMCGYVCLKDCCMHSVTPGTIAVATGQQLAAAATQCHMNDAERGSRRQFVVAYPPGHDHSVGRQAAPVRCALQDLVPADEDAVVPCQKCANPPHEPGKWNVRRQSGPASAVGANVNACTDPQPVLDLHTKQPDARHRQTATLGKKLRTRTAARTRRPGPPRRCAAGSARTPPTAPSDTACHATPHHQQHIKCTADLPAQPGVTPCICHRRCAD